MKLGTAQLLLPVKGNNYIYFMNAPKTLTLLLIGTYLNIGTVFAQDTSKSISNKSNIFVAVEQAPDFPGGTQAFYKYIASNLKYPAVASLLGLTGKVYLTFVVDKDGSVTDVKPIKCLGAGCESEAVRVVSMSPKWQPGVQKGKPVRVAYTIPITFGFQTDVGKTTMRSLRNSQYNFAFFIKGKTYSLDEAQKILGKSFDPFTIETVENFDDTKYSTPDKKEMYLVVMKGE